MQAIPHVPPPDRQHGAVDALAEDVERAASPAAARAAMTQLGDRSPGALNRLRDDARLRRVVTVVAGASASIGRVISTDDRALDVLADLDARPLAASFARDAWGLARWKRLELARIAARDLTGIDDLAATGHALATLADDVVGWSAMLAGTTDELVVVAMGKAGARELNYASDVDLLFVGGSAQGARRLLEIGRSCFRLDADLRPEGRHGPLTRSLASYEAYWDRWADPWEFQALLKARVVTGPVALAEAWVAAAAQRVWGRPFGAEELRYVRSMKARAEAEVARKGLATREIKRGRGGIRDIEFSIQLLQMVHGRGDERLRTAATLDALVELVDGGYVAASDADALGDAYAFLRMVEHRLQLVEEAQVHAVPVGEPERMRLARSLGYRDDRSGGALARFDADLIRHQTAARTIHERLFYRPLLEAFSSSAGGALAPDVLATQLAALGFIDAERTRAAVQELTAGLRRSSRLLGSMLPLLLEWLSESPDPDLGLLGLRQLASGPHRSARLTSTFRESPEAARRLCQIVGTSRLLTATAERMPDVMSWLADDAILVPRSRESIVAAATDAASIRTADERSAALQRLRRGEMWRIAAADLCGTLPAGVTVGSAMSNLGDAIIEAALAAAAPPMPMAVVALGRLGGREIGFASDLDVIVVHDERGALAAKAAEDAVGRFQRILNGATPAQQVWEVDLALRPEGKAGRLATSLDALGSYLGRWAQTWERQAAVRARVCAGDRVVGELYRSILDPWVWDRPFGPDAEREVRKMKARVERERIPAGEDPLFHLKLGRGSLSDVEWTVQLLQLAHGVRGTSTLHALADLVDRSVLAAPDAELLGDSWRFCESTRNRLFLVRGRAGDAIPTQADQLARLARSLGTTGSDLREHYRHVTRRARMVVDRVFYET